MRISGPVPVFEPATTPFRDQLIVLSRKRLSRMFFWFHLIVLFHRPQASAQPVPDRHSPAESLLRIEALCGSHGKSPDGFPFFSEPIRVSRGALSSNLALLCSAGSPHLFAHSGDGFVASDGL